VYKAGMLFYFMPVCVSLPVLSYISAMYVPSYPSSSLFTFSVLLLSSSLSVAALSLSAFCLGMSGMRPSVGCKQVLSLHGPLVSVSFSLVASLLEAEGGRRRREEEEKKECVCYMKYHAPISSAACL